MFNDTKVNAFMNAWPARTNEELALGDMVDKTKQFVGTFWNDAKDAASTIFD